MSWSRALGRTFVAGWWILPIIVFISITAAAFFTSKQQSLYRASATLIVVPDSTLVETSDILRSLETLERRTVVATYARIASTAKMRSVAGKQIGLSDSEARRFRTRASVIPNTNILRIDVEGGHAEHAALMANALAHAMEVEARDAFRVFTTEVLDVAVTPHRPFAPTPKRSYTVAGVLGLFLGIAAVYAVARPRNLTPSASA